MSTRADTHASRPGLEHLGGLQRGRALRALTRLRAATIKEFDTIARLETQAIDAYKATLRLILFITFSSPDELSEARLRLYGQLRLRAKSHFAALFFQDLQD